MAIFTIESIAMELCFVFAWSLMSSEDLLREWGDETPGMKAQVSHWGRTNEDTKKRWRAAARRAVVIAKTEQDITITKKDSHLGVYAFNAFYQGGVWEDLSEGERVRWHMVASRISARARIEGFYPENYDVEIREDEEGLQVIVKVTEDCGDVECPEGFHFEAARWHGYQLLMWFRENNHE